MKYDNKEILCCRFYSLFLLRLFNGKRELLFFLFKAAGTDKITADGHGCA